MKKVFALLLALTMVLSLAACGAKEEPAPEKEETKTETPAPAPEKEEPKVEKVTMKFAGTAAAYRLGICGKFDKLPESCGKQQCPFSIPYVCLILRQPGGNVIDDLFPPVYQSEYGSGAAG